MSDSDKMSIRWFMETVSVTEKNWDWNKDKARAHKRRKQALRNRELW